LFSLQQWRMCGFGRLRKGEGAACDRTVQPGAFTKVLIASCGSPTILTQLQFAFFLIQGVNPSTSKKGQTTQNDLSPFLLHIRTLFYTVICVHVCVYLTLPLEGMRWLLYWNRLGGVQSENKLENICETRCSDRREHLSLVIIIANAPVRAAYVANSQEKARSLKYKKYKHQPWIVKQWRHRVFRNDENGARQHSRVSPRNDPNKLR